MLFGGNVNLATKKRLKSLDNLVMVLPLGFIQILSQGQIEEGRQWNNVMSAGRLVGRGIPLAG